jgi:hypothetical protein
MQRRGLGDEVGDETRGIDLLQRLRPDGLQAGQAQQLLDEALHPGGLATDVADHLRGELGGRPPRRRLLGVQVGPPVDGGQRRPQLMGGVGDEVADPVLRAPP